MLDAQGGGCAICGEAPESREVLPCRSRSSDRCVSAGSSVSDCNGASGSSTRRATDLLERALDYLDAAASCPSGTSTSCSELAVERAKSLRVSEPSG